MNIQGEVKTSDGRIKYEIFESTSELAVSNKERKFRHGDDTMRRSIGGDWHGVKSYDEAEELLSNGWTYKTDELRKVINGVEKKIYEKRTSFKNNVVGYVPIVPLAIQGVPNSMIDVHYKPMKSKIVDIYYDITVNCGTSPEEILKQGIAITEAIIDLERQGYRVRLSGVQSYSSSKTADLLVIRIKNESQPLDLKRIMFPMMHPAMFRVIGFAWYERCPFSTERSGYGHNMSSEWEYEQIKEMMQKAFGTSIIYLGAAKMGNDPRAYIEEKLKGLK